jgi:dienelactone hydrolase
MGSPSFNMTAWRARHPPEAVDAIISSTLQSVASTYGSEYIGAVGYCFGGKYVARWLAEGKGVDAGFTAHPSGLTEEELQAIVNPISIAYAGDYN